MHIFHDTTLLKLNQKRNNYDGLRFIRTNNSVN